MKIQNKITDTINITAQGVDSVSNRVRYVVEGAWKDQEELESLFPGLTFSIFKDKVQGRQEILVEKLPLLYKTFTIQPDAVGKVVDDAVNEMGTKMLFDLNPVDLNLDLDKWELIN